MGILGCIFVLAFFVFFVVLVPYWSWESERDTIFTFLFVGPVSTLVGTALCGLLFFICTAGPLHDWEVSDEVSRSTEIYSIGLHSGVEGHFSLGCGTVNDKPVYYFFKKHNGGFIIDHIDAEKSTIIERDDITPQVKFIGKKYVGERTWFKRAVFGTNDKAWNTKGGKPDCNCGIIIYLPKGSVIQDYHIRP